MLRGVVLIKLGLNIWSWSFCVTAYQRGLEEVRFEQQLCCADVYFSWRQWPLSAVQDMSWGQWALEGLVRAELHWVSPLFSAGLLYNNRYAGTRAGRRVLPVWVYT